MSFLTDIYPEFPHLVAITNPVTGEETPVDIRIHRNDIDWLIAMWDDYFLRDWEIQGAENAQRRTMQQ